MIITFNWGTENQPRTANRLQRTTLQNHIMLYVCQWRRFYSQKKNKKKINKFRTNQINVNDSDEIMKTHKINIE